VAFIEIKKYTKVLETSAAGGTHSTIIFPSKYKEYYFQNITKA